MMTLSKIIVERNLKALETYCLSRTYREIMQAANVENVDLEQLEEMLCEIS